MHLGQTLPLFYILRDEKILMPRNLFLNYYGPQWDGYQLRVKMNKDIQSRV